MTNEELLEIIENERLNLGRYEYHVFICAGTGCVSSHKGALLEVFQQQVKERGWQDRVLVKRVGCLGLCAAGPIVSIYPQGLLYKEVTAADVPLILDSLGGEPVKEKLISTDMPFFYRQQKSVLENSGKVDPERIEDYIGTGGYQSLLRALTEMSPTRVIQEVMSSGLRGRGGSGFPTGLKWSTVAKTNSDLKYVICNADEGDPGAFMDRSILESDPNVVIEGMIIAAYAVGAARGYIYVRAEYPLAIQRLRAAISQAERLGLLGRNICNTNFDFSIQLRLGAGTFVSGEETALMAGLEGSRSLPHSRPPYPAVFGLHGKPTLVNNVETFANIPGIIKDGGQWFARIGTNKSKGTKVFALTGKVKYSGLIEVPMGITLREIIFDIGGGIPDGRKFKAVQTGGPSGGCIPEDYLDTPVEYESLKDLGSMMGSGGMIVVDDSCSMIDMARYFMEFCMLESCGKCVPCRVGTQQLYALLCKFSEGEATQQDLEQLEDLCDMVKHASLCGLGQAAPNPIISTLKYFRSEYLEKIKKPENGMHAEVKA